VFLEVILCYVLSAHFFPNGFCALFNSLSTNLQTAGLLKDCQLIWDHVVETWNLG